ncbi:MAG TPA: RNA polymerase sigma factor [Candidatus Baltobacteraceae bacterium]|jgi:RNA polymerase sigma-70 factor (ECF subfamily)|nr:RNA polymerase sigma factor [Candidatus Baltobacteraceae bacterium]
MPGPDFETVVADYHEPLYRFAISLTRSEADACDLVQQTFYMWATKGHQLRDAAKVKSWLFTTQYRAFLESRRTVTRFPHSELIETDPELPVILPEAARQLDAMQAVEALAQIDAVYRAPVALFYLEDYSYQEIADVLAVPIGTVKSRLARGLAQLKHIFAGSNPSRSQPRGKHE